VYAILGDSAAPGGQLFSLVTLTVAANFGGWLVGLTTLPRLIGMLFTGILMQNIGAVNIGGDFAKVTAELRKFALTIILTRAGLEMDPEAFKKIWFTIVKLGLFPWTVEAGIISVMGHFLLGLPWMWSMLLGSIIAAVSPAVVVPCLFRLRTKGYGVAKGIPTLIISIAGIDDAASVAIFGIISSLMFATGGTAFQISQGNFLGILILLLGFILLLYSSRVHSWWLGIWRFMGFYFEGNSGTWRRLRYSDTNFNVVRWWTPCHLRF
jgi:solute carrier family 9B (sodium/hydrogen exchanger), member 1/2